MSKIQLPQTNPLELLKSRTGYAEFIQNFANRLLPEPGYISQTILEIEKSHVHPAKERAERWGQVHDGVARAIGLEIESDVIATKLDMQQNGQNLSNLTPVEVIVAQDQQVAQDAGVFDINAIRATIDRLHIPTSEQLLAESPVGLDEAA